MTTLKLNTAGDGYAWDADTLDLIMQADGLEPGESPFLYYRGRGLGDLAWPFREKPVIQAFIDTIAAHAVELDTAFWSVVAARSIDAASGEQIMQLGRLVRAPVRVRFDDATNRALVDSWAQMNFEDANWEAMARQLGVFFGYVRLDYSGGAELTLSLGAPTAVYVDTASEISDLVAATQTTSSVNLALDTGSINVAGISIVGEGIHMFLADTSTELLHQYVLRVPWDVVSGVNTGKSLDVSTENSDPTDVFCNREGTRLMVPCVAGGIDAIFQYNMSTAFDLNTASYASKSLSLTTHNINATGVCLSPEGDEIYACSPSTDTIAHWSLGTAWELDSPTHNANFSIVSQTGQVQDLRISNEGGFVHVVGFDDDIVHEYSLSTAWDISTAAVTTESEYIGGLIGFPTSLEWSDDGRWFYSAGATNDVRRWAAATPFRLTSVSAPGSLLLNAWGEYTQATEANRPVVNPDTSATFSCARATMSSTDADLLAAWGESGCTLLCYAKHFGTGVNATLFGFRDAGGSEIRLGYDTSDQFELTRDSATVAGGTATDWHAIIFVCNGTTGTIYVDGTQVATGTIGDGSLTLTLAEMFADGAGSELADAGIRKWAWMDRPLKSSEVAVASKYIAGNYPGAWDFFAANAFPEIKAAGVDTTTTYVAECTDPLIHYDETDPPDYGSVAGFGDGCAFEAIT